MEPKKSPPLKFPSLPKPIGTTFRDSDDEWYSEHESDLLDMWHALKDDIAKRGIVMLDKCKFNHFCTFVLSMTTTQRSNCL